MKHGTCISKSFARPGLELGTCYMTRTKTNVEQGYHMYIHRQTLQLADFSAQNCMQKQLQLTPEIIKQDFACLDAYTVSFLHIPYSLYLSEQSKIILVHT